MYLVIKRCADIFFSGLFMALLSPIMILISILIKLDSKGPVFFRQKRFGRNQQFFQILKFRTMKIDAPKDCPSMSLENPEQYMTRLGAIIRNLGLDELPQLYNILVGHMSFVGPRPALWNQYELMEARERCGANALRPGLTGWAQINNRELPDDAKALYDGEYAQKVSLRADLKCVLGTVVMMFKKDRSLKKDLGSL